MASSEYLSQISNGNGASCERSALDYLLFMLSTVLIIVGVITLFFPLRELYIHYQNPYDKSVFVAQISQFLTNRGFVIGESGNTIVIYNEVAKNLAIFLFILFVFLFSSVGISLLKAGITIFSAPPRKFTKKQMRQSVSNLNIKTVFSTDAISKVSRKYGGNSEFPKQLPLNYVLFLVLISVLFLGFFIINAFICLVYGIFLFFK